MRLTNKTAKTICSHDASCKLQASLGPWRLDKIASGLTRDYTNLKPPCLSKNPPYIAPILSGWGHIIVSDL